LIGQQLNWSDRTAAELTRSDKSCRCPIGPQLTWAYRNTADQVRSDHS